MKTKKRIFGILLGLALVLLLGMSLTAYADDESHIHGGITFTQWNHTNALPTDSGSYYLTSNVTLDSTWNVSSIITLCLNGYGITKTGGDHVIKINSGGNLTIYDCGETSHFFNVENGKAVNVNETSGEQSFIGGFITGGTGHDYGSLFWNEGGGVYVDGGTFTLYGGTILGNSGGHGGGVGIYSGSMTMYGGTVCYNTAGEGGSGIGFRTGSAEYNRGSGATKATFYMYGGTVRNNNNGGVATCGYSYGDDSASFYGGTISDNGGRGIQTRNLTIDGDITVTGNKSGAGFGNSGKLLSGNVVISDNTDGNFWLSNNQTFTISGALGGSTRIGVKMQTPGVFTSGENTTNNNPTLFTSDDTNYDVIKNDDNQLELVRSYTVTYAGNEGTGTMTDPNSPYFSDSTVEVLKNGFTAPEGKMFAGFKIGDSDTIYANAVDSITGAEESFVIKENTTLTAVWKDLIPVEITKEDKEVTYSADEIKIPVEGMFTIPSYAGDATYSVDEVTGAGTFAENKLTVTKCGTFTVSVETAATETHGVGKASATLTVNKAANRATVKNTATVKKGGNTVELDSNIALNGAKSTVTYKFSGNANGCTLDANGKLTSGENTGSVTVNVSVAADDNYEVLAPQPITVTISDKNTRTVTVSDVDTTYGGTETIVINVTVDPKTDEDKISYEVKSGDEEIIEVDASTGALTIKKAGTATVIVKVAGTSDYAEETKEVTVTIKPADAPVLKDDQKPTPVEGLTDTGEEQVLIDPPVNNDLPEGYTMKYAVTTTDQAPADDEYTFDKTNLPKGKDADTYYVWYKAVSDDPNRSATIPEFLDVTIAEKTEELTVKVDNLKQDASRGLPSEIKELEDELEINMTITIEGDNDVKVQTVKPLTITIQNGVVTSIDENASFNGKIEGLAPGKQKVTVSVTPKQVVGQDTIHTEEGEILGPVKWKYELSARGEINEIDGKDGKEMVVRIYLIWDNGVRPEPIKVVALPEDEIGAYRLNDDGTKEYLLFHTYDICMNWLGSDDLCRGYERCFHKENAFVNPFVKP